MEQQLSELIMHYGYLGLILALAGGIVGLPVPDELLLTFIGYNVSLGRMTYTAALMSGLVGAVLGITISYVIGLKLGLPVVQTIGPRIGITEAKLVRTHLLFEKYGPFLLIIGYFLPGIRHLTAYFAGMSFWSFRKFCFFAYVGAFIWVSIFITLGWRLGENWQYIIYYFHRYGIYFGCLMAMFALVMLVYWRVMKRMRV